MTRSSKFWITLWNNLSENWYSHRAKFITIGTLVIAILALIADITGILGYAGINIFPLSEDEDNTNIRLSVNWTSENEIEVSWRNLPLSQNPYLMISDKQHVYNPIKVLDSPEKERIAIGEGITWVVIIIVSDDVSSIEQIDGVEINDPRIKIIAQAPVSEK